jgi:hypothetical protein
MHKYFTAFALALIPSLSHAYIVSGVKMTRGEHQVLILADSHIMIGDPDHASYEQAKEHQAQQIFSKFLKRLSKSSTRYALLLESNEERRQESLKASGESFKTSGFLCSLGFLKDKDPYAGAFKYIDADQREIIIRRIGDAFHQAQSLMNYCHDLMDSYGDQRCMAYHTRSTGALESAREKLKSAWGISPKVSLLRPALLSRLAKLKAAQDNASNPNDKNAFAHMRQLIETDLANLRTIETSNFDSTSINEFIFSFIEQPGQFREVFGSKFYKILIAILDHSADADFILAYFDHKNEFSNAIMVAGGAHTPTIITALEAAGYQTTQVLDEDFDRINTYDLSLYLKNRKTHLERFLKDEL